MTPDMQVTVTHLVLLRMPHVHMHWNTSVLTTQHSCCVLVWLKHAYTTNTGPGRDIITSGWQALSAGRPDMNSLVGLGATASFAVSCVAAALPALHWKTFFEEPAMLLGECWSGFQGVRQ